MTGPSTAHGDHPLTSAALPRLSAADRDGIAHALREYLARAGSWLTTFDGRSMEPGILSGSVLCVERLPDRLCIGDLLVFVLDLRVGVCCHRVIALRNDGSALTQGDNVKWTDGFIDPARFVGVVRRHRVGGRWYRAGPSPRRPSAYRRLRHRLERFARRARHTATRA